MQMQHLLYTISPVLIVLRGNFCIFRPSKLTKFFCPCRAKSWVRELKAIDQRMVIALVGNKSDLQDQRQVRAQEANLYAEEQSLLFLETSAKTALNVNELFFELAEALPKKNDYDAEAEELRSLPLSQPPPPSGGGCCGGK